MTLAAFIVSPPPWKPRGAARGLPARPAPDHLELHWLARPGALGVIAAVRDTDEGPAALFVLELHFDDPWIREMLAPRPSEIAQSADDPRFSRAQRRFLDSRRRVFRGGRAHRSLAGPGEGARRFRDDDGAQLFGRCATQKAPIGTELEVHAFDEEIPAEIPENLRVDSEGNRDVAAILGERHRLGWVLVWHLCKKLCEGGPSRRTARGRIGTPPPGGRALVTRSDRIGLDVDHRTGSGVAAAAAGSQPGSRTRNGAGRLGNMGCSA